MNKKELPVSFAIDRIKTEQFAIFEKNYSLKREKDTEIATELNFNIDKINRLIRVFVGIEFVQAKKTFLKIQVSCHFKIKISSWEGFLHKGNEESLVIPKGFLAHVAMITIGTTRGVLFSKTESTEFSKFIIPTINVAEMIPTDANFKL
jgi:hypothetical protein